MQFNNSGKEKKYDKIVLLPKSTLNGIDVLISKALINSNICDDEFVLLNNIYLIFHSSKIQYRLQKIQ